MANYQQLLNRAVHYAECNFRMTKEDSCFVLVVDRREAQPRFLDFIIAGEAAHEMRKFRVKGVLNS